MGVRPGRLPVVCRVESNIDIVVTCITCASRLVTTGPCIAPRPLPPPPGQANGTPMPTLLYGYGSYGICIEPEFSGKL